ncbi:hypothetical protein THF1C08_380050 [Vibrio jasicida]|uniref:DUF3265 domain-containing protein n=1 Tax=Vibrio jasicida TaxID=766224 RepID=A0AAU9QQI8_9VIBR|nr:hypothetical protein THF1C08_380050 [Vibrio jasicida]CAH1598869.1 hypothetical protein THF1A12_380049 [Vibrio jasicida]
MSETPWQRQTYIFTTFKFHFGMKYKQESFLLPVVLRRITERFVITVWTALAVFSDLADG